MKRTTRFFKKDGWIAAGILVVAAIFRLYHIFEYPVGILFDTSVNGTDAWRLTQRSELVPFLFANGGRESLFIYLQALAVSALGTTNLAVRLPGVLVDLGTVALVFAFTRWLTRDRWAAIFAGFAAATSFWLIPISRLGFRAILVPPVAVAAVWLLLLAWQTKRWRLFALAGGVFGVLGYTYLAARVMPLVLVAFLPEMLPRFSVNRTKWRRYLVQMGVLVSVAMVVFSPMWLYVQPFASSGGRTGDVALWNNTQTIPDMLGQLWQNILVSTGYFCCVGNDKLLMFGRLNQPAFLLGTGFFVLAGISLAVWRSRELPYRVLWIWWAAGLLPGILSIEAPHALRLIVSAVPAFVLLGVWMGWMVQKAEWLRWVGILWLAVAAGFGFVGYHFRWAESPAVATMFNADAAEQAHDWLTRTERGEILYVPQKMLADSVLRYYLLDALPLYANAELPATVSLPVDIAPDEGIVRLGQGAAQLLPPLIVSRGELPSAAVNVSIPPLRLASAAYPFVIPPDGELPVTLFWQTDEPLVEDYLIVLQLLDDARQVWSVDDAAVPTGGAYPPRLWRAKTDTVPDVRTLHLKDDLPAGRYQLAVAVFDPRTGNRLPLGDGSGDTLFLRPLKVPPAMDFPAEYQPVSAQFAGVGTLAGYLLPAADIRAGEPLSLTLLWRADATPSTDYTVFVHVLDSAGNVVGGQDNQPLNNRYPTTIWSAGEKIVDPYLIPTDELPPGEYRLSVGMYESQSGARVAVDGAENGEVLLSARVVVGK